FERLMAERAKSEAEYRQEVDQYDPEGYPKQTPEWYQKRLAMPIRDVLKPKASDPENDPLPELTERATRLEGYVNKWANTVRELEAAPAARKQWINSLPSRALELEQALATTRDAIAKIDSEGVTNPVTSARRLALA